MILPVLALGIYIVSITPEFADRINTAIAYVESGNIEDVRNKTTFSFVSNLEVATVNFLDTYGLGVGLGGHETTYLRNFNMSVFSEHWYGLNYKSGHALTIRIISELGILGIMIFFMMFYKTLKIKDTIFRSIALASLGHFIATSFKLGSYLDYGTIFMFVMIITMIKLDRRKSKDIKKGLII